MAPDPATDGGRSLATRAVHAGQPAARPGGPVVAPIVRSSTFHWSGPGDGDLLYSRYGNNPNQRSVAAGIAALEGTESALALASGMAAIAGSGVAPAAKLAFRFSGSHGRPHGGSAGRHMGRDRRRLVDHSGRRHGGEAGAQGSVVGCRAGRAGGRVEAVEG